MKKIKYSEIKRILESNSFEVNSTISHEDTFDNLNTLSSATNLDISFFSNSKYIEELKQIKAKACLIKDEFVEFLPKNCKPIIVKDPYLALALISKLFNNITYQSNGVISKYSSISKTAKINDNVHINPFS